MIAVRAPIPPINGIGISSPNNARLGTVCMTFANPSTGARSELILVSKMPSGTPTRTATPVDKKTSSTCPRVNVSSSGQFDFRKSRKDTALLLGISSQELRRHTPFCFLLERVGVLDQGRLAERAAEKTEAGDRVLA